MLDLEYVLVEVIAKCILKNCIRLGSYFLYCVKFACIRQPTVRVEVPIMVVVSELETSFRCFLASSIPARMLLALCFVGPLSDWS